MTMHRRHDHRLRGRRPGRSGFSLTEALVFAGVLGLLMTGVLALVSAAATTGAKTTTLNDLGDDARLAMDEVLYQVRSGDRVLATQAFSTLAYQTNGSNIVLRAPGYNDSTATVFTGNSDYVAFRYDRQARTLTETMLISSGSDRPTRREKVLARNVDSVIYSYRVRDQFTPTEAGTQVLTLSQMPVSAPTTFVNGQPANGAYTTGSQTVTVTTPHRGSDVQIVYAVSPTANSGAALASVTEVDVSLRLAGPDRRSIERVRTLQGGARLRNRRL